MYCILIYIDSCIDSLYLSYIYSLVCIVSIFVLICSMSCCSCLITLFSMSCYYSLVTTLITTLVNTTITASLSYFYIDTRYPCLLSFPIVQ